MRKKPFMRDYAEHGLPLIQTIQAHQKSLAEALRRDNPEEILHLRGPLGEAYRRLGRLDDAIAHLTQAVALAREGNRARNLLSNVLRLAVAVQYAGRSDEAEALFREALQLAKVQAFLEDHVALAYGKHLIEGQRWQEAAEQFSRACQLRQTHGTPDALSEAESIRLAARDIAGQHAHFFDS